MCSSHLEQKAGEFGLEYICIKSSFLTKCMMNLIGLYPSLLSNNITAKVKFALVCFTTQVVMHYRSIVHIFFLTMQTLN